MENHDADEGIGSEVSKKVSVNFDKVFNKGVYFLKVPSTFFLAMGGLRE